MFTFDIHHINNHYIVLEFIQNLYSLSAPTLTTVRVYNSDHRRLEAMLLRQSNKIRLVRLDVMSQVNQQRLCSIELRDLKVLFWRLLHRMDHLATHPLGTKRGAEGSVRLVNIETDMHYSGILSETTTE